VQRVQRGDANANSSLLGCRFETSGGPRVCYFAERFNGGFIDEAISRSLDGANQVRHSFAFTPLPQNPSRTYRSLALWMF